MLTSRRFWLLFARFCIPITGFALGLGFIVFNRLSTRAHEFAAETLQRELQLVKPLVQRIDEPLARRALDLLGSGAELAIINSTGDVLFNSRPDLPLTSPLSRPEIEAARLTGVGFRAEKEAFNSEERWYGARLVNQGNEAVFLLIGHPALPVARISPFGVLAVALALGLCLALFMTTYWFKRVLKPVQALESLLVTPGEQKPMQIPLFELGGLGAVIETFNQRFKAHLAEREEMERMRRDFSTNIAHELKTPLTSIKGYTETLLAGALDDTATARKFLEIVGSNVDRLIVLVNDLLKLATIESAKGEISREPVSWSGVIYEVAARLKPLIDRKNLTIYYDFPENTPKVWGEPRAMSHIADNLLTNAIHYTELAGQITIRTIHNAGSESVALIVLDNGIGISPQNQERIFERFFRVSADRGRTTGGTGLGLAIVKHFVNRLNGEISLKSELGVGSEFTVWLAAATNLPS